MSFREIDIRDWEANTVKAINDDWALVTAGDLSSFNSMTVSWGGLGELWGRDVAFIFIRPHRFTYRFLEENDYFTLSFFGGGYKKELEFFGKNSGRDVDKVKHTGFSPLKFGSTVSYEEAQTVLLCKKIAFQDLNPAGFFDRDIENEYPKKDYHRIYVGEIMKTFKKF